MVSTTLVVEGIQLDDYCGFQQGRSSWFFFFFFFVMTVSSHLGYGIGDGFPSPRVS